MNGARAIVASHQTETTLHRLRSDIQRNEAANAAGHAMLEAESLDDRFTALEREDRIERLLEDLKSRQARLP